MNIPNASRISRMSRVFASYQRSNLTNASFRWQPDEKMQENAAGRLGVTLIAHDHSFSATAMLVTSSGGLSAVFTYHTPNRVGVSERMPVAANEPIHLELDVDPKTSNMVMWINDKGLDMGVIPGFNGGADSARWHAGGNRNRDKLNGKLTDCAIATAAGWSSVAFRDEHINRDRAHDDHVFEIAAPNSLVTGNRAALA